MADHKPYKLVANNKKAYHDYFIEEKYECGIELFGTEVKSIRMGKCSIKEAYVVISGGQAYIEGMNISPYEKGNIFNREPLRRRRLLLHKSEILRLQGQVDLQWPPPEDSRTHNIKKRPAFSVFRRRRPKEQVAGIEPVSPAWEAGILPMNYTCKGIVLSTNCIIAEIHDIASEKVYIEIF